MSSAMGTRSWPSSLRRPIKRVQADATRSRPVLLILMVLIAAASCVGVRVSRWSSTAVHLGAVGDVADTLQRREPERRVVGAQPTQPTGAPGCSPGSAPGFSPEFADLSHALGETMGQPRECAHVDAATGDRIQLTSTGLAVYKPESGVAMFTDGYRHWALQRDRLDTWEGDQPESR
jgi:hypothetical protein